MSFPKHIGDLRSAQARIDPTPSRKHIPMAELIDIRRAERMDKIDRMPPELRALVHEYGLTVVNTLLQCGVTNPRRIKHIVETVLDEFSPTRGTRSIQGIRGEPSEPELRALQARLP